MKKNEIKKRIDAIDAEIRSILESAKADQQRGFDEERQHKVAELKAERASLIEEYTQEMLRDMNDRLAAQNNDRARAEVFQSVFNEALASPMKDVILTRAAVDMAGAQPLAPLNIGDIIGPLEKGIGFDQVGCRVQYGLEGDWLYPVLPSIEATIAGESVALSDSAISLTSVKPEPKRVGIVGLITRSTLHKSAGEILNVVTYLLQRGINMFIDKWLYSPTAVSGSSQTASGPFVAPATALEYSGALPTYAELVGLKGQVKKQGIRPDNTAGYVMSHALAAALEATPITAGDSKCIITDGRLGGVPVHTSEYVGDDTTVLFGYFSYALVGQFGDMSLIVDPVTKAESNQIRFIINSDWDIKAARTQAFGKLTKSAD